MSTGGAPSGGATAALGGAGGAGDSNTGGKAAGGSTAGDAGSVGMGGGSVGEYTPPSGLRSDVVLKDAWRFIKTDASGANASSFDDSGWATVALPHTWNASDGQDGGNNYYRGPGWYRCHFTLPITAQGKSVYLQFDGASTVANVYVNGMSLGEHRGGFGRFRFDATAALKAGVDNVIAVKVSNAEVADVPPLAGDFTVFGGLYRDVHVLVTDQLHVDTEDYGSWGVYLDTSKVSAASADLKARVRVRNNRSTAQAVTVNTVLVDAAGKIAAKLAATGNLPPNMVTELAASTTIQNPHLWNGRVDPYLYTAHSELQVASAAVDYIAQHVGFRFYGVDANAGFSLNGQYLDLHGVNRHQDRLNKGWAIGSAEHDEDFALIKELGATAIRLAHYQHAEHVYDLTDQLGIVTWAEVPLVNTVSNGAAFTNNAKQQLTELIRQNYNHPSIAFWSMSNEEHGSPDPNPVISALNTLAHSEDTSRLTTLATANADSSSTNYLADLVGFNKYYGWYDASSTIDDFAPWLDSIHGSQGSKKVAVSEFGAGSSISTHSLNPQPRDHTEEYQNLFHETYWKALSTRKFIWGKFIWNMFDFAADDRAEGDTRGRNDKGLVTYDRKTKKDSFFWYKANWSADPFVYITSRRLTARKTGSNPIKIYSNASSVDVKLNGTSLGAKTSQDHIFSWTGSLKSGSNTVEVTGTAAGQSVTDSVTWTAN
jgi:beta-galactosidase